VARRQRFFSDEEYAGRLERVRASMAARALDGLLLTKPESIYYVCGLDHMGYFAYQALLVPLHGRPVLVTRAMERATVRDQVPDVEHVGYSDGAEPLPPSRDRNEELTLAKRTEAGDPAGLRPWETSLGVETRRPGAPRAELPDAARATREAIGDAGLGESSLGIEKSSSFLPLQIAEAIFESVPDVRWEDVSQLVDDCRLVQSERELACTRQAAVVTDAMMLAAIAAAGPGVPKTDVIAAVYSTMARRGGTYPGFVPLIRSTKTLQHEHGTWDETRLASRDVLFLEMSGCVRRYHAPMGRLVFIGRAPGRAQRMQQLCLGAFEAARGAIVPGAKADDVYRAWQDSLSREGLSTYTRHHCGYAVGIGYPPSWSGGGVPQGLRRGSTLELRAGMVFHLMSWLLRTGRGDAYFSDSVVVTESGCERLTSVSQGLIVR
jgi:Xaa-Pro dipeptidase